MSHAPKEVYKWHKGGFSSHLASDEITTRGYMALTFAKCRTVMTAVLTVTSSLGSCFTRWYGVDGNGLVLV
jgi:hypothetical protein